MQELKQRRLEQNAKRSQVAHERDLTGFSDASSSPGGGWQAALIAVLQDEINGILERRGLRLKQKRVVIATDPTIMVMNIARGEYPHA